MCYVLHTTLTTQPHSYFVNDHKQSARDVLDPDKCPTRSDYGIPEDKFVFCNFNQIYKIEPSTFAMWMRILSRVPNSVLWLLRFPALGESNIRAAAKAAGVPEHRIIFTDVAPKDEHLRRGYLADLFLDTPTCNAHTTGCDILWGGTPMVTLVGERMASRVAASLLGAASLSELVVGNEKEYEELAVALAMDIDRLWAIRKKLEDSRLTAPLFDTARWVRNFEQGLKMMWARHEMGMPPAEIVVPDVMLPADHKVGASSASASASATASASTGAGAGAGASARANGVPPSQPLKAWGSQKL